MSVELPAGEAGETIDAVAATSPERPGPVTASGGRRVRRTPAASRRPAAATDGRQVMPRPETLDPQQLGFTPRRPVPWLSPLLLAGTAVRVGMAALFGAYLDKRELQGALPIDCYDERPGGEAGEDHEVWLDYVSDIADGFNASYSVAYLLAQPRLCLDGLILPRGRALVFGGDEVYPTPSGQQYLDRCTGPYRSAMPEPPPDGTCPSLYALPGNHDWYDGLTAFLRVFARSGDGGIGGWRTRQSRSYFAIRLPRRWWLFAIDTQSGAYLDDPQLGYFRTVAGRLEPGDQVILCPPTPGWVEATMDPAGYDTIDYFIRTIIEPTGAEVRLMLSGDLHHFAHYTGPDRDLITCGGGGAYLYATHRLPETLQVPPPASLVRESSPSRQYRLAGRYPSKSRSRAFGAGVFARLPWRNPGFVGLIGVLHLLLMLAMANAAQRVSTSLERRLLTIPVGLMTVLIVGSTLLFAMPTSGGQRRFRHWVLGFGHGLAHIGLAAGGTWAWLHLPAHRLAWPLPELAALVLYLPLAGLAAAELAAGYLLVAGVFDVNLNELFASQSIIDAKSFLRLRFAADGTLTIYPIGIDRVPRRWKPNPDAAPHRPWIEPAKPLRYHLIQAPIRIGRGGVHPPRHDPARSTARRHDQDSA